MQFQLNHTRREHSQDPYFTLLKTKRVQFLDITRGYVSIAMTLRGLRNENEHLRRLCEALQNEDFDDLDELDGSEDDGELFEVNDIY